MIPLLAKFPAGGIIKYFYCPVLFSICAKYRNWKFKSKSLSARDVIVMGDVHFNLNQKKRIELLKEKIPKHLITK